MDRSAQSYLLQKAGTNSLSLSFEKKSLNLISDPGYAIVSKEIFRTCNVLPFSCTHLASSNTKDKAKIPEVNAK